MCCTALVGAMLSTGGQAQAMPGTDSGTPASAPNASTTTTSSTKDKVVLKVGDLQVTQATFEQYLSDLEAQQGPADLSRKKLGENYSSLLVLEQKALANHLDQTPDVVRQLAIDRMQILSNAEFARLKKEATPSAPQIKAYYDAHLDDYDVVNIRRVFIFAHPNPQKGEALTREQAKAMAEAVKSAIAGKKDVIATINAIPHGRTDVVADPDPLSFQRGALPPTMDKAAFALKEGEWTQLSDNPDEFVFIQLVNRSRKPLDEVSSQIEKQLQAEHLREELNALKSKTGVWMDEEYFASKNPATTSTTPEASGQEKSRAERGEK